MTVRIGGIEVSQRECGGVGGAEHGDADRIGPQNAGAVERPQPRRQRARRVNGQPWVGYALHLEIGAGHGHRAFDVSGCCLPRLRMSAFAGDSPNRSLVSRPARLMALAP
jgi:hypothetical protein